MANTSLNDEQPEGSVAGSRKPGSVFPWKRWDVILSTVVLNILTLAIPLLVLQLYDRIIPNQSYGTLSILGIAVGMIIVIEAILRYSRGYVLGWLGMHFEHGAAVGAFQHLVNSKLTELNKKGVGEHVENIESTTILKEFLAGQGFLILIDLPFVILFLGFIAYFSVSIALAATGILGVFVFIAWFVGNTLRECLETQMDLNDRRYNFIVEILTNHHTLKALGMEDLVLRRFERLQDQCSTANYQVYLHSAEVRDLAGMFSFIMFVGVVAIAALEVINSITTIGVMAAAIVLTSRAMQPIQAALSIWEKFQHFTIAKKRIEDHFDLVQEPPLVQGVTKPIQGKVTLRDVYFRYDPESPEILKGVDLVIEPGTTITIHGKNSVGKTTLMWVLMGNLHPHIGSVLIDDEPITAYQYQDLRRQMAYIPAKGILFQGTIMENLTMYRGATYADDAMDLSRQLGLDDWIRRLPQGYNTKVGDQLFLLLPDGIHQRICLVRALVNRPKIIILDEANTSLDQEGDILLREIIQNLHGKVTIIFVTHRPSIKQLADESYELVDGLLLTKEQLSLPPHERVKERPQASSSSIEVNETSVPQESNPEKSNTSKSKKSKQKKSRKSRGSKFLALPSPENSERTGHEQ